MKRTTLLVVALALSAGIYGVVAWSSPGMPTRTETAGSSATEALPLWVIVRGPAKAGTLFVGYVFFRPGGATGFQPSCSGSVAGKPLAAVVTEYQPDVTVCVWQIPRSGAGKILATLVSARIERRTSEGGSVSTINGTPVRWRIVG